MLLVAATVAVLKELRMTTNLPQRSCGLVFTFDDPTRAVAEELIQLADDRAHLIICNAGEALRLVHRHEPAVLFVCTSPTSLEQSTETIEVLHRRRPELPLLAIAARHDEGVERAVRVAGVGHYFALDAESDCTLMLQTLDILGLPVPATARASRPLVPPRARGAPPVRAVRL